jgi:hypothetical protein
MNKHVSAFEREEVDLRDTALAILHNRGTGREGILVYEQQAPYLLLSVSTGNPLDKRSELSVWANLEGKRAKVLKMAWDEADEIELISIRRGEWEDELRAIGRSCTASTAH